MTTIVCSSLGLIVEQVPVSGLHLCIKQRLQQRSNPCREEAMHCHDIKGWFTSFDMASALPSLWALAVRIEWKCCWPTARQLAAGNYRYEQI